MAYTSDSGNPSPLLSPLAKYRVAGMNSGSARSKSNMLCRGLTSPIDKQATGDELSIWQSHRIKAQRIIILINNKRMTVGARRGM